VSTSHQLSPASLPTSNFEEKMKLELQNMETNMTSALKAAVADAMTLMASKPPPTIVINQDHSERSNQQALESRREIESIQRQLGR
jgi:hypothetical protein